MGVVALVREPAVVELVTAALRVPEPAVAPAAIEITVIPPAVERAIVELLIAALPVAELSCAPVEFALACGPGPVGRSALLIEAAWPVELPLAAGLSPLPGLPLELRISPPAEPRVRPVPDR